MQVLRVIIIEVKQRGTQSVIGWISKKRIKTTTPLNGVSSYICICLKYYFMKQTFKTDKNQ